MMDLKEKEEKKFNIVFNSALSLGSILQTCSVHCRFFQSRGLGLLTIARVDTGIM